MKTDREVLLEIFKAFVKTAKPCEKKYMMGTTAYHCAMGDDSSKEYDIAYIHHELDEYWVGNWVTGAGLMDVLFPKSTTRDLTEEEIAYYSNQYYQLASNPPHKLNVGG